MDSLITAAAQALAAGDPLGALRRVALREDPPALALRGIAMAQLADFDVARQLLQRAARAFGAREPVARARCILAEAEVALAARELGWSVQRLDAARATLEAHGDAANAAHARQLAARRFLLLGKLDAAQAVLDELEPAALPAAQGAVQALLRAGLSMRRLRTAAARAALDDARRAAWEARIPALDAEVDSAQALLQAPAARLRRHDGDTPLSLADVEALFASNALVVDACRYTVRTPGTLVALARRPVLFALAQQLAEAWPGDVPREALIAQVFRGRHIDETHRARLRVEIGRLRAALQEIADVQATARGFELAPRAGREVVVLSRPLDDAHAEVLALLADGEAWSSSALALALGASQRSIQRAVSALHAAGTVQSLGRGRARRWITPPMPGIATTLLLPGPLPGD